MHSKYVRTYGIDNKYIYGNVKYIKNTECIRTVGADSKWFLNIKYIINTRWIQDNKCLLLFREIFVKETKGNYYM